MNVQFMGAARTVTGSCYIIEAAGARFTVDCGMSQGNSEIEARNWDTKAYRPGEIDFILLTHAHIDHSGLLPRITREGFKGPIYCTPPTVDLVSMMLEDSAHIQETEAARRRKQKERFGETNGTLIEPLYTLEDARKIPSQLQSATYGKKFTPHPGITVEYHDAGHILGAAYLELTIEEDGKTSRLVFSGDLGRKGTLLMHSPDAAPAADYVFLESTYGDRNHKNEDDSLAELHEAILYAHKNNEKVIIPAFAVGRTQEILYSLFLLHLEGKLPTDIPIFVDSPLAIRATEIFVRYKDYLNIPELAELGGKVEKALPNLHFTLSTEESQALNAHKGSGIIIAASGMCNAGRIRHHLRHNAWREGSAIVFVGYQGQGTPGRKIVDGAKSIRIFNEDIAIKAKVFTIGGFSAHAGQSQLLDWIRGLPRGTNVILVHGEDRALSALSDLVEKDLGLSTSIPEYLGSMDLLPGRTPVVVADEAATPRINWDTLIRVTDSNMATIRQHLENASERPWAEQVEMRDRLLELNKELISVLSEL